MKDIFKLLLFVFLLAPFYSSGQKMYKLTDKHNSYLYKGEVYKYDQMRSIFSTKPESLNSYDESIIQLKSTKLLGTATLTVAGIGLAAVLVDPTPPDMYCDLFCLSTGETIGILALVVSPIMGLVYLVQNSNSIDMQETSIILFNDGLSSIRDSNWNLKIGTTPHGLGLVLNF